MKKTVTGRSSAIYLKLVVSYSLDIAVPRSEELEHAVSSLDPIVPPSLMLFLASSAEGMEYTLGQPVMAAPLVALLLREDDDEEHTLLTLREWTGSQMS